MGYAVVYPGNDYTLLQATMLGDDTDLVIESHDTPNLDIVNDNAIAVAMKATADKQIKAKTTANLAMAWSSRQCDKETAL